MFRRVIHYGEVDDNIKPHVSALCRYLTVENQDSCLIFWWLPLLFVLIAIIIGQTKSHENMAYIIYIKLFLVPVEKILNIIFHDLKVFKDDFLQNLAQISFKCIPPLIFATDF